MYQLILTKEEKEELEQLLIDRVYDPDVDEADPISTATLFDVLTKVETAKEQDD